MFEGIRNSKGKCTTLLHMLNVTAHTLTVGLSAPTSTAPFTLQWRVSRQVRVGIMRWGQGGAATCVHVGRKV